jgi:hypothetical protein
MALSRPVMGLLYFTYVEQLYCNGCLHKDFAGCVQVWTVHTFVLYRLRLLIFVLGYQTTFLFICNFIQKMSLISIVKQAV